MELRTSHGHNSSGAFISSRVPAFNAEYDILEGHPTIGGSRAIWVVVMVVFMTVGVWLAQEVFWEYDANMDLSQLVQNAVYGGLAAAGFGVSFNVGFRGLTW
jgi:hypothetical protein